MKLYYIIEEKEPKIINGFIIKKTEAYSVALAVDSVIGNKYIRPTIEEIQELHMEINEFLDVWFAK